LVPKIDMGPFAAENVINEIQIRQGKWISLLAQTSEAEPTEEAVETATAESDTDISEQSAIPWKTLLLLVVLGVLIIVILVVVARGRTSQ
jgi:hypothetical protein